MAKQRPFRFRVLLLLYIFLILPPLLAYIYGKLYKYELQSESGLTFLTILSNKLSVTELPTVKEYLAGAVYSKDMGRFIITKSNTEMIKIGESWTTYGENIKNLSNKFTFKGLTSSSINLYQSGKVSCLIDIPPISSTIEVRVAGYIITPADIAELVGKDKFRWTNGTVNSLEFNILIFPGVKELLIKRISNILFYIAMFIYGLSSIVAISLTFLYFEGK